MIDTILHVGKFISKERDPWEDITETIDPDTKEGKIRTLQLNLLFDLDQKILTPKVIELDGRFERMKRAGAVKVRGGNSKAIYPTVEAKKLSQLVKTLFGKEDAIEGELYNVISTKYPQFKAYLLYDVLKRIYTLRSQFDSVFYNSDKSQYNLKEIENRLDLSKADKIFCIATQVLWLEKSITECYLAEVEGFSELIHQEFFAVAQSDEKESAEGLDYVTGTFQSRVAVPKFAGRYNINKFFVQETCNFASQFDKGIYAKNYQVTLENQTFLDRGSAYLLDNYRVKIANLDHVIIPQFLKKELDKLSLDYLRKAKSRSDLLFGLRKLVELSGDLEDEEIDHFWLNFLAIDSDGNYFKASNLIKDVPSFHFEALIKQFISVGKIFRPWLRELYAFNIGRMYFAIPVRKDVKKNRALLLFAAILEQRKIDSRVILQHFIELILCHWYGRYKAYSNIKEGTDFVFLAKDAVFMYLAFFTALKNLELITNDIFMEADNLSKTVARQISADEGQFIIRLGYNSHQQALFYLGRALNRVAYAQSIDNHNKPVLNKLNYNGMDRRSIILLANDLMEKGNQYKNKEKNPLPIIEKYLKAFFSLFPAQSEDWKLSPQEALFFILSGYTYSIKAKPQTENTIDTLHE